MRPFLVACLLLLSAPARAVVAYDLDGPFEVTWETTVGVSLADGTNTVAELYYPKTGGAHPGVALLHGFASDRFTVASVGRHLASWGFVVVTPNLPSTFAPDARRNAAIARALVDTWLPSRSRNGNTGLSGRVADGISGVMGHSAGGLAAVLALADAPADLRTAGVLLDWVDSVSGLSMQPADLGKDALPGVSAPAQFLFAEPSSCNSQGNGVSPSARAIGPRMQLKVVGATHCDPGDPAAFGCIAGCGAVDAARQRLFLGYGTAWLRRFLLDDLDTEDWLGGTEYADDLAAGRIVNATIERLPPFGEDTPDASVVDAGTQENPLDSGTTQTTDDAGEPDPTTLDAGDTDTTSDGGDDDDGVPATGCGCGGGASGLALVLLAWRPGRRRALV